MLPPVTTNGETMAPHFTFTTIPADQLTTTAEPSKLLTIRDIATHLRCSRRTVSRLIATGDLDTVKDGRRTLIPRWSLNAYIDQLPRG
jgi:excisionase family DNA binding protein